MNSAKKRDADIYSEFLGKSSMSALRAELNKRIAADKKLHSDYGGEHLIVLIDHLTNFLPEYIEYLRKGSVRYDKRANAEIEAYEAFLAHLQNERIKAFKPINILRKRTPSYNGFGWIGRYSEKQIRTLYNLLRSTSDSIQADSLTTPHPLCIISRSTEFAQFKKAFSLERLDAPLNIEWVLKAKNNLPNTQALLDLIYCLDTHKLIELDPHSLDKQIHSVFVMEGGKPFSNLKQSKSVFHEKDRKSSAHKLIQHLIGQIAN